MTNNDLAIVILAAGKGTRLKSRLAKVLHRAGGRSLVEQVLRACAPLKAKKTIVVVGHQADRVTTIVEPLGAEAVLQQPQNGTGHAMKVAQRAIGKAKYAIVLPGDAPLIRTETLKALLTAHRSRRPLLPLSYRSACRSQRLRPHLAESANRVSAIVEESQLADNQREINEINSSIYCFTLQKLWPALAKVQPNNRHRELYLTDAAAVMAASGETVLAQVADDSREVLGCNTRLDLAEVDKYFSRVEAPFLDGKRCQHSIAGDRADRPRRGRRRRHRNRGRRAAPRRDKNWRALHYQVRQRPHRLHPWR